jgi:glycerophosphoryl diester phosphodiesterase
VTHPWFTGADTPRVLAHRGLVTPDMASDGIAENSFAAIAHAHAIGVPYVESDCHLTRDGVVVLFHDDDLTRITGDPRPIADVDLRELARLMAPRGGLATLAQALEAFPSLRFNLDVKAPAAAVPVGQGVAEHGARVLVTSFSDERRRAALRAASSAATATDGGVRPSTSAGTGTVARLLAAVALGSTRAVARVLTGIDAIQIPERHGRFRVLTPRLIRAVHRVGVEVHVWTVNDPHDMLRLVALGVDGIVTDRADVALDVLRVG